MNKHKNMYAATQFYNFLGVCIMYKGLKENIFCLTASVKTIPESPLINLQQKIYSSKCMSLIPFNMAYLDILIQVLYLLVLLPPPLVEL